ncbi:hypothetical protein [Succinimonas amylolytica]|uniref:hypothetical protein n=1 Tax=Succinimonas amylolytica TaxID=83769 RepID=UPI0003784B35|nr:hypothetical protein [Succinimonas amylolytica]
MILVMIMLISGLLATVGYVLDKSGKYSFSALCYMFYGSCLMWVVDLVAGLREEGTAALALTGEEALDDILLSLSVILLALTVWAVILTAGALRRSRCPAAA